MIIKFQTMQKVSKLTSTTWVLKPFKTVYKYNKNNKIVSSKLTHL